MYEVESFDRNIRNLMLNHCANHIQMYLQLKIIYLEISCLFSTDCCENVFQIEIRVNKYITNM